MLLIQTLLHMATSGQKHHRQPSFVLVFVFYNVLARSCPHLNGDIKEHVILINRFARRAKLKSFASRPTSVKLDAQICAVDQQQVIKNALIFKGAKRLKIQNGGS